MKTTTAIDSMGALTDGNAVMYSSPSFDLGGASASFMLGYTPEAGDAATGEGGVSAQSAKLRIRNKSWCCCINGWINCWCFW